MAASVAGGGTQGCRMERERGGKSVRPQVSLLLGISSLGTCYEKHPQQSSFPCPPAKVGHFHKTGAFQDLRSKHEPHSHVRRTWSPASSPLAGGAP